MKALLLSIFIAVSVASAEPVVVVVRHAEKAISDADDPDLSPAGRARAEALARILNDSGIKAIFTSEFKRTQETAAPTAASTHIAPTVVAAKDTAALTEKLHQLNGNALVIAHSNTIPDIIKALGIKVVIKIPDTDYSDLFIVVLGDKPQLFHLHYSFQKANQTRQQTAAPVLGFLRKLRGGED
jgi:phosphohistidine phosphatase SixA